MLAATDAAADEHSYNVGLARFSRLYHAPSGKNPVLRLRTSQYVHFAIGHWLLIARNSVLASNPTHCHTGERLKNRTPGHQDQTPPTINAGWGGLP